MERRYQARLDELLDDAEVRPGLLRGLLPRLETFLEPFVASLCCREQRTNARHYVRGCSPTCESKDAESIAYLHDRERQGLQKFIGQAAWDHRPLDRRAGPPGRPARWASPTACWSSTPRPSPRRAPKSVGVQRQWCGRLGKVENCQVGVYLGYVSRQGHALVDFRLYLPKEWAKDRKRMQRGRRAQGGPLPHPARAGPGDARRARRRCCRTAGSPATTRWAAARGSASSCASGASATCWPCRRTPWCATWCRPTRRTPGRGGASGRRSCGRTCGVRRWRRTAWETVEVRDGEKGPLVVQVAWTLVQAKTRGQGVGRGGVAGGVPGAAERRQLEARLPAVQRDAERPAGGVRAGVQGGAPDRGVPEAGQERGGAGRLPGEDVGGLAPPPVPVAAGDLVPDARKPGGGKMQTPALTVPEVRVLIAGLLNRVLKVHSPDPDAPHRQPPTQTQRGGPALPLATTQTLAASTL